MCMSTPSVPEPEPMPEAPPAQPPPVEQPKPTPAPELVNAKEKAPKISAKKSKRGSQQQAARGTNALKIPLSTGASKPGLNIPT